MKKIIYIFIIVIATVSVYFLISEISKKPVLTFESQELGISLKYPERFGKANLTIDSSRASSGKQFFIRFDNNRELLFGGISEDFSAGRSGTLTDTRGFTKNGDKYLFKFVNIKPETEVIPQSIINTEAGEVIILDNKSFEAERNGADGPILGVGDNNLAGLMNLPGEDFNGIVFWNLNTDNFTQEEFEEMLKSIKSVK